MDKQSSYLNTHLLLLFLVAAIAGSCSGNKYISEEAINAATDLENEQIAEKVANTLGSGDPELFIPVVNKLAGMDPQENFDQPEKVISALKELILKNMSDPEVKDPAIQALAKMSGSSRTFDFLAGLEWEQKFYDSGKNDWKNNWTLDGQKATINNTPEGMEFYAGPVPHENESHAVLWTKEYFTGDLNIEYDYTRLDDQTRFVNILYIQATGSGEGPHSKDIMKWSELRNVAAMNQYFGKMYLYHVSYAAFGNDDNPNKPGYIRARRYMAGPLKGTELEPDYAPEGLFGTDVPHHIHVIKTDRHVFMKIDTPQETKYCHWYNTDFPAITEGYVGLRHMCTRAAKYADLKISELKK